MEGKRWRWGSRWSERRHRIIGSRSASTAATGQGSPTGREGL